MKKTKKYLFTTAAAFGLMLFTAGCGDFLNINTSPNSLKTASTTQALISGATSLAFYAGEDLFLYSSIFVQQAVGSGVTGSQSRIYDQYTVTNADVNNIYGSYYSGILPDLDYVKTGGLKEGNNKYAGMARILEAAAYQTIIDAWGDAPYKEALKGVTNVQPKFDASREVYDSLFALIDLGITNLGQSQVRTITAAEDYIYAGDMAKWTRFANTLKLRMALHYAKVDGGTKLKALITAGGFMTGNGDNFAMSFENVANRQNPISQFEVSRVDYYAPSQTLINTLMNTKNDPRRATYFTPYPALVPLAGPAAPPATTVTSGTGTVATLSFTNAGSTSPFVVGTTITVAGVAPIGYNGTYVITATTANASTNVATVSYANTTTGAQVTAGTITYVPTYDGTPSNSATTTPRSRIHTYLRGSVTGDTGARVPVGTAPTAIAITYDGIAPNRMLTFAEYNFIMAEAVKVYGATSTNTAQQWYAAGITASMTDAGVATAAQTAYLASNGILPGTAADLQFIIEEKFVANYGVSMEPWTDWRRTGFPALTPSAGAVSVGNTTIPRILVYPLAEQQTNLVNVPNRATMSLKGVFWDN